MKKIRSPIVLAIGTREDLTRVMDAECCIASMAFGEVIRPPARGVCTSHRGNPETGRILPYRLHMRTLLLRLMRLLDHQIKPMVIFDGVMLGAKRREIPHRRDQQQKVWHDNAGKDDGGKDEPLGVGGGGAWKRTAKKILVKQLKEWRENGAMMQKKKMQKKMEDDKSGEGDASMDDVAKL